MPKSTRKPSTKSPSPEESVEDPIELYVYFSSFFLLEDQNFFTFVIVLILHPSFLEILGLETLLHGMAAYMHNLYKVLTKVKSM
jgi:hypothetical protein